MIKRVYGHKLSKVYESQKRKSLREDAEEFIVLIAMKDSEGSYTSIGYADKDTDLDYEQGIYGYDSNVRENVHAMTRYDATELCNDIIENAPAGDVIVGVVPYSTIPAEGGSSEDIKPSEEDMEIPGSEDAETSEESEDEESEDEFDEGDEMEESVRYSRLAARRIAEKRSMRRR